MTDIHAIAIALMQTPLALSEWSIATPMLKGWEKLFRYFVS